MIRIAALLLAVAFVPTAAAMTFDADETQPSLNLTCTGQPTGDPRVDGVYQLACSEYNRDCDMLFRPCPLRLR